jgi:hypothetical protein
MVVLVIVIKMIIEDNDNKVIGDDSKIVMEMMVKIII